MKQRKTMDMTQGVIWKQLVTFAIPLLIGQLFQQLYSTVDSVVVGRFVGKEALAAVGSTGNVINALISFFGGLSMGGTVVISQFFGAKNEKGVHNAVHTILSLTFFCGIFVTALGMFATPYMLRWMNTPDDVIGQAQEYLSIYFSGVMGLMVYNLGSGILRSVGDSRRPLYFLIFSAMTNLVLDVLFVVGFGWGIAGVAYATIIAQFLSAVLIIIVLCRSRECYRLVWKDLRVDRAVLLRVLKIGLPTGLQQGITSLSNVFVQSYMNAFQSSCMAGYASYQRIDSFAWLPMMCIGMANTTFVGQNLGAGNMERAKRGTRTAFGIATLSTAAVVAVLMIFNKPLLSLFNVDTEVLRYGSMFVLFMSPFYIPYCSTQIFSGALRGAGDSFSPMVITLSSFVAFRQVYLFIGTKLVTSPLFVASSYPAGWVVASVAMYLVYRSRRWERNVQSIVKMVKN